VGLPPVPLFRHNVQVLVFCVRLNGRDCSRCIAIAEMAHLTKEEILRACEGGWAEVRGDRLAPRGLSRLPGACRRPHRGRRRG
jgi:hypothetical protein